MNLVQGVAEAFDPRVVVERMADGDGDDDDDDDDDRWSGAAVAC